MLYTWIGLDWIGLDWFDLIFDWVAISMFEASRIRAWAGALALWPFARAVGGRA